MHHAPSPWPGRRGPRMFFRGGFPSRPELIERLENHQRDLEQQLADIADVLTHLRDAGRRAASAASDRRAAGWPTSARQGACVELRDRGRERVAAVLPRVEHVPAVEVLDGQTRRPCPGRAA